MTIKVGDRIPSVTLRTLTDEGPKEVSTDAFFKGRKVVLFAVPGAFTRTCSAQHLPGFLQHADAIKAKGVDGIACTAVNDAFVMGAWSVSQGVGDKVIMLADGNADFATAVGLETDSRDRGFGVRSKRYAMIVEDGIVKSLHIEEAPGVDVSGAESILSEL